MYRITTDGTPFFMTGIDTDMSFKVLNPKLELEMGKAGSLTFQLPVGNIAYDKINKLISEILVTKNDKILFRGRCINDEKDFYNHKTIACEGDLAFLMDTYYQPYVFQGVPSMFFNNLINRHNTMVDHASNEGIDKRFTIGQMTVDSSTHYMYRANEEWSVTLDELNAKLLDTLGGYLRTRHEDGKNYIDCISEYEGTSTQSITFGNNLLDLSNHISAENIVTRVYPLGAMLTDDEGNNTSRVDISSVNNGIKYLENTEAIKSFGLIEYVYIDEDYTVPANLKTLGQKVLEAGILQAVTITISAFDLSMVMDDVDSIEVGDKVRVVSAPHGINDDFTCTKIVYDLADPANTEYTFGELSKTLTEQQAARNRQVYEDITNKTDDVLELAKENATSLITSAMGGYVYKTQNELYIMDTPTPETATKVWRWNLNGLGYSPNGVSGPYELAMTMDGAIVADKITTGYMYATRIRGGDLTMGGLNNTNGRILVLDSSGNITCKFDNDGADIRGNIKSTNILGWFVDINDGTIDMGIGSTIHGSINGWRSFSDGGGGTTYGLSVTGEIFGIMSNQLWVTTNGSNYQGKTGSTRVLTNVTYDESGNPEFSYITLTFVNGIMVTSGLNSIS